MKQVLILFAVIALLLQSCLPEAQNKWLTYQNIIILSDMSDRLLDKDYLQKDTAEIHKIVQFFEKECVKPGEKIGDKSSIHFSALSENKVFSIDIDEIKFLGDKQSFINSTGKYQQSGLKQKLIGFEATIAQKYNTLNDFGLDLLSILIEKIQNDNIVKKDKIITDGIDTTFIHYENHIYIFTDGYLEYTLKTTNNQFRFGPSRIKELRSYCQTNNLNIDNAIQKDNSMCLLPVKKELHKYVNIHVWETHERDFNINTQTYNNPIGLRDNEILEAIWTKWAIESEFKSFEWKKY